MSNHFVINATYQQHEQLGQSRARGVLAVVVAADGKGVSWSFSGHELLLFPVCSANSLVGM